MGGLVDFYVACEKDSIGGKKYDSYQTAVINLNENIEVIRGYADNKVILELFVHNDNGRLIVSNDPGKKHGLQ